MPWICIHCTYGDNADGEKSCCICSRLKEGDGWVCTECTYLNLNYKVSQCKVCKTKIIGISKKESSSKGTFIEKEYKKRKRPGGSSKPHSFNRPEGPNGKGDSGSNRSTTGLGSHIGDTYKKGEDIILQQARAERLYNQIADLQSHAFYQQIDALHMLVTHFLELEKKEER